MDREKNVVSALPGDREPRDRNLEIKVGDDVSLRLITQADADKLFRLVKENQAYLQPWVGWANEASFNTAFNRQFIEHNLAAYDAGTAYAMGIYEDGILKGSVDIRGIDEQGSEVEIGYWLAEDAQGRGLAVRSAQALIDFSQRRHEIQKIVLHTMTGNKNSAALAKRLGFTYEGEVDGSTRVREKRCVRQLDES